MTYSSLGEFFIKLHSSALRYALALVVLLGGSFALPLFLPSYFYWVSPIGEVHAAAACVALILTGFVLHTWWLRHSYPVFDANTSLADRLEYYRKTVISRLNLTLWLALPTVLLNLFFLFQWIAITFLLIVFLLLVYWPSRRGAVSWLQLKGAEREWVLKG